MVDVGQTLREPIDRVCAIDSPVPSGRCRRFVDLAATFSLSQCTGPNAVQRRRSRMEDAVRASGTRGAADMDQQRDDRRGARVALGNAVV